MKILIDFIKIAYRNIFRNLRRSILCIIAVGAAVFLVIFMMSYIEGMLTSAKRIVQTFESGHIKITTEKYEEKELFFPLQYPVNNYEKYIEEIKSINGVSHVSSRIISYATYTNSKVKHGFVGGIDFNEIKDAAENKKIKNKFAFYNYTNKSDGIIKGRLPDNNKNECMIGYRLAKKMEIIYPVIEKNEFIWILNNTDTEEHRELLNRAYNFDDKNNIYNLILFQDDKWKTKDSNDIFVKMKLKQLNKQSKDDYLELLDFFMKFEAKKIPEKIGTYANSLESILRIDYQKELLENMYEYQKDSDTYVLMSQVNEDDRDYMLKLLNSGISLKIPFKILSSQYSDKYFKPELVGIFEYDYAALDEYYILISFKKMQRLSNLSGKTQSIYVYVDNLKDADEIKKKIENKLNGNTSQNKLVLKAWSEFPFIAMFRQFEFLYIVIYGIFIIMASFLIINTIIMVINERIKEIGMMGAIGMRRAEIVIVFFLEAVILSLIGSLAGTLLGAIVTRITTFLPISLETMTGGVDFPVSSTIFIIFSPIILLKGFAFGTFLTALCTIFPSLKSAFIEPVEALRK